MIASNLKLFILGIVFLQAETCKKELANIPPCILTKIAQLKTEKIANPPASVWQYEYNGKIVYYIPAKCCDIPSLLYDSDCNLICSPDGGFTGKGDGKCSDFAEKRTKEKLIWKDDR
jgi:hypothetical protein